MADIIGSILENPILEYVSGRDTENGVSRVMAIMRLDAARKLTEVVAN